MLNIPKNIRPNIPPIYNRGFQAENLVDPDLIKKLYNIILESDLDKFKLFVANNNINLNIKDPDTGQGLIHILLSGENNIPENIIYKFIEYLISQGAPINIFDQYNISPIHLAAKNQYYNILELLLKNGANPDAVDSQNMTPLAWAAQGIPVACKPFKKNPEIKLENNNNTKNNFQDLLKKLTIIIIDILYTDNFARYINHIKNFLQINLFPDLYQKNLTDYYQTINNILNSNNNMVEVQDLINNQYKILTTGLSKLVENNLENTLKKLDIKPDFEQNQILPNILPSDYKNNLEFLYNQDQKNIFEELNNISTNLSEYLDKFTGFREDIFNNIHDIIQINNTARISIPGAPSHNQLKNLILNPDTNLFEYPDLNIIGQINLNNPQDFLAPNINTRARFQRGTRKQILAAAKSGHPINLTVLPGALYYPQGASTFFINNPANPLNPGNFDNRGYYYISKSIFSLGQINKHINSIIHNIGSIQANIQIDYLYTIYYPLISNIILSEFNIFQDIYFYLENFDFIKNTSQKIYNLFDDVYNSDKYNPDIYYIENCALKSQNILKIISEIKNNFDQLFILLVNLKNKLNNLINLINNRRGYLYAISYINNFDKPNTEDIVNFFDQDLKPINMEDLNIFDNYYNQIKKISSLNNIRKYIYQKYLLNINTDFYPVYLINQNFNLPVPVPQDLYTSISSRVDTNNPLVVPYFPPGDLIPRAGYLVALPYRYPAETRIELMGGLTLKNNGDGIYTDNNIAVPGGAPGAYKLEPAKLNPPYRYIGQFGITRTPGISLDKSDPAGPIGSYLDPHLFYIKYEIIKNIIQIFNNPNSPGTQPDPANPGNILPLIIYSAGRLSPGDITNIKTSLINLLNTKIGLRDKTELYFYSIVGKITDNLIINYIHHNILTGLNIYLKKINPSDIDIITPSIFNIEPNFELIFNNIFENIISAYYQPNTNLNPLLETNIFFDIINNNPDQIYNYNQNYNLATDIKSKSCWIVKPEIINLLIKYGADINHKDISQTTPIYYSIGTLYEPLIQEFIKNRASVYLVKNISGFTPFSYLLELYFMENFNINTDFIKNILDKFTEYNLEDIINNMDSDYIIKNLDILFPEIILLYNNLFYLYAKSFINNWTWDKFKNLEKLLLKYGILKNISNIKIPLLLKINPESISKGLKLNILYQTNIILDQEYADNNKKLAEINNRINNIQAEIADLNTRPEYNNYILQLNNQITNLTNQANRITGNIPGIQNKLVGINTNLTNSETLLYNNIITRANNFYNTNNYLKNITENNITGLYQNLFNMVISGPANNGYQDHIIYNNLWADLISDEGRLENIFNFQLIISDLSNQIITKLKNTNNKQDFLDIQADLEIIQDLYQNIFNPLIMDFNFLPQELDSNYILFEIYKIITQAVSHIICSNLYYAIIKTITKYIISNNPKILGLSDSEYRNMVNQIINNIIRETRNSEIKIPGNNLNINLYDYITKIIPGQIIKILLNIYQDESDEIKLLNLDKIFEIIGLYLINNINYNISADSPAMDFLNNNIFEYYKKIFNLVIPKTKIILDNYNRYILNQGKFIGIIIEFINGILTEI